MPGRQAAVRRMLRSAFVPGGRLARLDYLVGEAVAGAAFLCLLTVVFLLCRVAGMSSAGANGLITLLFMPLWTYPSLILSTKRLNDMGYPAYLAMVAAAGPLIAAFLRYLAIMTNGPAFGILALGVDCAWLVVNVMLFVVPGEPGSNRHGPRPQ